MSWQTDKFLSPYQSHFKVRERDFDLRGCEVYDRNHYRLGIISEIYCCEADLTAKYAEIAPFEGANEKTYLYPFDAIGWSGDGPAFLNSPWADLNNFQEYDADLVLEKDSEQFITYNEALDLGLQGGCWESAIANACA